MTVQKRRYAASITAGSTGGMPEPVGRVGSVDPVGRRVAAGLCEVVPAGGAASQVPPFEPRQRGGSTQRERRVLTARSGTALPVSANRRERELCGPSGDGTGESGP